MEPRKLQSEDQRHALGNRIRIFAIIQSTIALIVLLLGIFLAPAEDVSTYFIINGFTLALGALLYAMRFTPYAQWLVYLDLAVASIATVVGDFMTAKVSGDVWVLLQIIPLIALIVIRDYRAVQRMCVIVGIVLVITASIQIGGLVWIEFLTPPETLFMMLIFHLILLTTIATIIGPMLKREQQALEASLSVQHQLAHQSQALEQVNSDLEHLNTELEQKTLLLQQKQEQIIDTHELAIRELSTPLLPLAHNILVMPLIGTVDGTRAQNIMETLLEGIAVHRATITIIDITGVKLVDTQVAQALIHTAQAVQLLGAQVVLTGIKPEMAQTLINLGADLSGITTQSTLQSGVSYAMSRG